MESKNYKIETFVTELNGVITGYHRGDINADYFGTPYYGHNKIKVPREINVTPMEPLTFYTEDWQRIPTTQLIKENILPMPSGYKWEGEELEPMTQEERIIEGLDELPIGFKVESGKLLEMTKQEKVIVGLISQEEIDNQIKQANEYEFQSRLMELQSPENTAKARLDNNYNDELNAKLAELLAVKNQKGWPLEVEWPE